MGRCVVTVESDDGLTWRMGVSNGRITAVGQRKAALERDEPSYTDPEGRTWYPYLAEFRSKDGQFCVEVWAMDDDHAERQLSALRETAALLGRIVAVL